MHNKKSHLYIPVFLVYIFASIVVPLIKINPAYAAANSGEWVNGTIIKYEGNVYKDVEPFDGNRNYRAFGTTSGSHCGDIDVSSDRQSGTVFYKIVNSIGVCENVAPPDKPDSIDNDGKHSFSISLTNVGVSRITAYRTDENTIFMPVYRIRECPTNNQGACARSEDNGIFKRYPTDVSAYNDNLFVIVNGPNSKPANQGYAFKTGPGEEVSGEWIELDKNKLYAKNCKNSCGTNDYNIVVVDGQPPEGYGYPSLTEINQPPSQIQEDQTNEPSCEDQLDFAMAWLICGILNFVDNAFEWLRNGVEQLLTISPAEYNNDGLREAWSTFRYISSFLLLFIGLVMIIGQAVSKD